MARKDPNQYSDTDSYFPQYDDVYTPSAPASTGMHTSDPKPAPLPTGSAFDPNTSSSAPAPSPVGSPVQNAPQPDTGIPPAPIDVPKTPDTSKLPNLSTEMTPDLEQMANRSGGSNFVSFDRLYALNYPQVRTGAQSLTRGVADDAAGVYGDSMGYGTGQINQANSTWWGDGTIPTLDTNKWDAYGKRANTAQENLDAFKNIDGLGGYLATKYKQPAGYAARDAALYGTAGAGQGLDGMFPNLNDLVNGERQAVQGAIDTANTKKTARDTAAAAKAATPAGPVVVGPTVPGGKATGSTQESIPASSGATAPASQGGVPPTTTTVGTAIPGGVVTGGPTGTPEGSYWVDAAHQTTDQNPYPVDGTTPTSGPPANANQRHQDKDLLHKFLSIFGL